MKKWKALLLTAALQAAQVFVPAIPNEMAKNAAAFALLAINGAVVKKISESNPDGTPASVAYEKETK